MGQMLPVTLPLETVLGVESWNLQSRAVDASLTRLGGHLAPVTFKIGSRRFCPYSVAPWATEPLPNDLPNVVKVLRGDFFCMPYGINARPFNGEQHAVHGQTANEYWQMESAQSNGRELHATFSMTTTTRPAQVKKLIRLVNSHTCLYTRHTITGGEGLMPLGHHAMLRFPDEPMSGLFSTSAVASGQVCPIPCENPATRGYQSLKPGATFKSLHQVPMIDGAMADLTHFPARPGFDDLVMLFTPPRQKLGWSAVTFPREGYVWFALRDARILRNTVLWISHGGRHYAPWNGRHTHVLSIQDATAYFHMGLAESAGENDLTRQGQPTAIQLSPDKATVVNYISGIAPIPTGFDRVASLKPADDGRSILLTSQSNHQVSAAVDLEFLQLS